MDAKDVKELQEVRKELMAISDKALILMDRIQKVEEGDAPAENIEKAEKPKKAPNAKPLFDAEPKKEEAPAIKISDVKSVLMEKAKAGFDKEVHELIKSYNVEKLSAVPEEMYADLLEKAKVIGNG